LWVLSSIVSSIFIAALRPYFFQWRCTPPLCSPAFYIVSCFYHTLDFAAPLSFILSLRHTDSLLSTVPTFLTHQWSVSHTSSALYWLLPCRSSIAATVEEQASLLANVSPLSRNLLMMFLAAESQLHFGALARRTPDERDGKDSMLLQATLGMSPPPFSDLATDTLDCESKVSSYIRNLHTLQYSYHYLLFEIIISLPAFAPRAVVAHVSRVIVSAS
jgi:hypothetical protein